MSVSMSISVKVYLFSQANPRSFVAQVIALMAVVSEIRLLAFYSMIRRSSAIPLPHRFPPYRFVQPKSQTKVKKQIICLVASQPSPGFKPGSAAQEASGIQMCHNAPIMSLHHVKLQVLVTALDFYLVFGRFYINTELV